MVAQPESLQEWFERRLRDEITEPPRRLKPFVALDSRSIAEMTIAHAG